MAEDRSRHQGVGSGGNLPPWLQGVPLPTNPSPAPSQPSHSAAVESSSVGALPDWLRELQSDVSEQDFAASPPQHHETSEAQPPDWLSNLASEPTATSETSQETRPADNTEVPDWLRELSSLTDEPTSTPPERPAAQDAELPGWLQNMPGESEPFTLPVEEQPVAQDEALPSWLQGMSQETTSADESATVELPSEPPVSPQPRVRLPSGATDWLRSLGEQSEPDEPPQRAEPPQSPPTADDNDGIPAWLRDVSSDELERDLAESASQSPEPGPLEDFSLEREGEVDAPSWLMTDAEDRDSSSDERMPEWLRNTASPPLSEDNRDLRREAPQHDNEHPTPDDVQEPPQTALPSWLRAATSENPLPVSLTDEDQRVDIEPPSWLQTPDADAIPSWLQESDDEPPARDMRMAQATDEPDLPDWLRSSDAQRPADNTPAEAEIPAWLQSAEPDTRNTPSVSVPQRQDDDLPSWLRTEPPDVPQLPEPRQTPESGDDLPDWLRSEESVSQLDDMAQQHDSPVDGEPPWLRATSDTTVEPETSSATDDIPDWLRPTLAEPRQQPPPSDQNDSSLPDWLHSDDRSTTGRDSGLPTWLRGAETSGPPPSSPPSTPAQEAPGVLPPWLQEESEENQPESVQQNSGNDFLGLGGADLPGWLRNSDTPAVPEPPVAPTGETYSDWIARLRTQQDEEGESDVAVAEPPTLTALQRPVYAVTPQRMEAITLLQRLVADPFPVPAAAPATEGETERRRFGLEQGLYLLLLLALLLGLLMPQVTASFEGPIVAPGAGEIAQRIDQLGENDVVLVAYEWDARRRGELAPLEQSVMNHLAQRKVKFVFVSTDLQGTLLSYDARDRLISQFGYRTRGLDYILLGYKPGGELALRQMVQNLPMVLASDFQGADANQSAVALDVATGQPRLNSIRDFAMVVMMADEAQDVQAWMEQVRPQMDVNKPLVLLMPTETTPVVQPYLRQPGVLSLSGRQGALAYEQQRGGDGSVAATAASGQVPFAIISFSVLLVVGALIGGLATATQRRR